MKTKLNQVSRFGRFVLVLLMGFWTILAISCTSENGSSSSGSNNAIGNLNCDGKPIVYGCHIDMKLTGAVTTPIGPAQGTSTAADTENAVTNNGNSIRFSMPAAMQNLGGLLYVADAGNNKIRRINLVDGTSTVLAGPAAGTTTSGDTDGTGTAARFNQPTAFAISYLGLYVSDTTNNKIRLIK
jgi:hypothetical protein